MDQLASHFIENEPRRQIGHVLDVEVAITRGWWAMPLSMLLGGQLLGRLFGPAGHHIRSGLGFTACMAGAGAMHALGHMASARLAGVPMDTLLVTPMRPYTLYDDTGKTITRHQDVGRAIGGPVANLTVGIWALLLSLVVENLYLRFFAIASFIVGLAALIPVWGNDGEVLFLHKKEPSPLSR